MSGKIDNPHEDGAKPTPKALRQARHYFRNVRHLDEIDIYRVLDLFHCNHPALQDAVKKILVPGLHGTKNSSKDIEEAILSLHRWQEMQTEDVREERTL